MILQFKVVLHTALDYLRVEVKALKKEKNAEPKNAWSPDNIEKKERTIQFLTTVGRKGIPIFFLAFAFLYWATGLLQYLTATALVAMNHLKIP